MAFHLLCDLLSLTQPLPNQFHVPARRFASDLRFFLEDVQNVQGPSKSCSVDGAERIAAKILHHFHQTSTGKPGKCLGVPVPPATLRDLQGVADVIPDWLWKRA
jgi:hypothetical protein